MLRLFALFGRLTLPGLVLFGVDNTVAETGDSLLEVRLLESIIDGGVDESVIPPGTRDGRRLADAAAFSTNDDDTLAWSGGTNEGRRRADLSDISVKDEDTLLIDADLCKKPALGDGEGDLLGPTRDELLNNNPLVCTDKEPFRFILRRCIALEDTLCAGEAPLCALFMSNEPLRLILRLLLRARDG